MQRVLILAFLAAVYPDVVLAHAGHADGGWRAGFSHPFHGWDHLVAMVAVGLWAAQTRRGWLPLAFVGVMIMGAGAAMAGLALPGVEPAILVSTVVFGALALFKARLAAPLSLAVVALFAFCHGFAHGAEMPADSHAAAFVAGFALASALLHGAGALIALAPQLHLLKEKKAASTRQPNAAK